MKTQAKKPQAKITLEQFNKEKGIATITSFKVIDNTPKHTQGEWKISGNKTRIKSGANLIIADCRAFDNLKHEEAVANAERIVTAVNSFDELLESLKESQKLLQRIVNGEKPTTLNEQITLNILAINKAESE